MNILEEGDIIFQHGNLIEVDELKDIEQNLRSIFNTRKGEFFLDIDYGLDYSSLEDKTSTDFDIYSGLMDAISQEDRVTEIVSIDINRNIVDRLVQINLVLMVEGEELDMEVIL